MYRLAPVFWFALACWSLYADRGVDEFRFCMVAAFLAGITSLLTQIRDRL